MLTIHELFLIVKKYFWATVAAAFLGAVACCLLVLLIRDYTCTLNFKYNYTGAEDNLAPDGVSALDPYALQNPAIIHSALDISGFSADTDVNVEEIRNNITINKIYTTQDQEVAESAAVLGESYIPKTSEYQLTFTYPALRGENYGRQICNGLIHAYDEYFIESYYNKEIIPDFMQSALHANVDYLDIANVIQKNFDDVIATLNDYAAAYPSFRSKRTGYTFSELAELYQNAENNLYTQLQGNIRAGNLASDPEVVIKNYTTTIRDLQINEETYNAIAESYKSQISTFYDSYKATGLYRQAAGTQVTQNSSNNRDQSVLRDYEDDFETLINTYDDIVLSYTQQATLASNANLDRVYYQNIIQSLQQDQVPAETKSRLIQKNESLLQMMADATGYYCSVSNESIDELFDQLVAGDIQYLISTNLSGSISVPFTTVFAAVFIGAVIMMCGMIYEVMLKTAPAKQSQSEEDWLENLDRERKAAYEQYKQGFSEFYIVYQEMMVGNDRHQLRYEAFVRWKSAALGAVPVNLILQYYSDLNLVMKLNDWIVNIICQDINRFESEMGVVPVIHINCMFSEVADFGMAEILHKNSRLWNIKPANLCVEMDGRDIMSCVDEIMLMEKMGYQVCVDHFEDKTQADEILAIFRPNYVKVSGNVFKPETSESKDINQTGRDLWNYLKTTIDDCHKSGIGFCVSGVETAEQDDLIHTLDIDYRQGFFYSYPDTIDRLLKQHQEAYVVR